MRACRVQLQGVVQGVGFRPSVWRLARTHALTGWVRNNSSGLEIHVEGAPDAVDRFLHDLHSTAPPLARIDAIRPADITPEHHTRFRIIESLHQEGHALPVSPDVATCDDCLAELRNPDDRRYRYPFINCTNCGPRFSITRDIPYDRPNTTMAHFPMCPECRREYENPDDRRFHAQPIACPTCGPHVWLEHNHRRIAERDDAVTQARRLLAEGHILAVKGLGGFHLACDATSPDAVARLRARKKRDAKPFALMAPDVPTIERHTRVSPTARALLESPQRPIVLLPRRSDSPVVDAVAPALDRLGFMLPYTPLHHLLLEPDPALPDTLVMTSANLSDEPIVYRDEDTHPRLDHIADAFLLHDRPIHVRTDDSVTLTTESSRRPYPLRRSRGYAPLPIRLPRTAPHGLAVGAELKNVPCLTRDDRAILTHHIGDLQFLDTHEAFEHAIDHFQRFFRIRPAWIAHDLHPDYHATRYALDRARRERLTTIPVQHHHAHIAACMADNALPNTTVIGVALDGTGYGPDHTIWGGEFLICDYTTFNRALHLEPAPLPGGDAAVHRPDRIALAWLRHAGIDWTDDLPPLRAAPPDELPLLRSQLEARLNTPLTSSAGRLFDALASLADVCHHARYEAEAPARLEAAARTAPQTDTAAYPFELRDHTIDWRPALHAAVDDLRRGLPPPVIAARFHRGVARMVLVSCRRLRDTLSLDTVVLSGGTWQNALLLDLTIPLLEHDGFATLTHHQAPANDAGLALGQAAIASFLTNPDHDPTT